MFYFVVVWKAPRPPRDSTWFTLGVSKCPVLHISRRVIWKCVETLPSILHFSSLINLGLSILPLDKVLVFCETKILNWGGNFFLSWEITQDAIKMCFADGNICKPSLSEKYMVFAQWWSWQKAKCARFSPRGWFFSICTPLTACAPFSSGAIIRPTGVNVLAEA